MKRKFKIGDEVILVGEVDQRPYLWRGTILAYFTTTHHYKVQWEMRKNILSPWKDGPESLYTANNLVHRLEDGLDRILSKLD